MTDGIDYARWVGRLEAYLAEVVRQVDAGAIPDWLLAGIRRDLASETGELAQH